MIKAINVVRIIPELQCHCICTSLVKLQSLQGKKNKFRLGFCIVLGIQKFQSVSMCYLKCASLTSAVDVDAEYCYYFLNIC